jgi:hypothetical protein
MESEIESFIIRMTGVDDEVIKDYFEGVRFRGLYFVELKNILVERFIKKKYTYEKIAKILNLYNHSTVVHHFNHRKKNKKLREYVLNNMDTWLSLKQYPYLSKAKKIKILTKNELISAVNRDNEEKRRRLHKDEDWI